MSLISFNFKYMSVQGNLFVISAASGTGKSSLVKALLKKDQAIRVSISHTTRKPRGDEMHGSEYFFVDSETFQQMIKQNQFLEWALVHDNYYGTSKQAVIDLINQGIDVVLEIDVQGALQVQQEFPEANLIFILPPSWQELKNRLNKRGEDSVEVINQRLNNAAKELLYAKQFKFVIINEFFDKALDELIALVKTQRLSYKRQKLVQQQLFQTLGIVD